MQIAPANTEQLERRAKAGDPEAQNMLGQWQVSQGNYAAAADLFQQAADAGLPEAIHNLAVHYRYGLGREYNPDQAHGLREKAARLGHMASQFLLAVEEVADGPCVRDLRTLRRLAEDGYGPAHAELADYYLEQRDQVRAYYPHLQQAARSGSAQHQLILGTWYGNGNSAVGILRGWDTAYKYFSTAAGNIESLESYERLLEAIRIQFNGHKDVKQCLLQDLEQRALGERRIIGQALCDCGVVLLQDPLHRKTANELFGAATDFGFVWDPKTKTVKETTEAPSLHAPLQPIKDLVSRLPAPEDINLDYLKSSPVPQRGVCQPAGRYSSHRQWSLRCRSLRCV